MYTWSPLVSDDTHAAATPTQMARAVWRVLCPRRSGHAVAWDTLPLHPCSLLTRSAVDACGRRCDARPLGSLLQRRARGVCWL
jgi:hypothetical protein